MALLLRVYNLEKLPNVVSRLVRTLGHEPRDLTDHSLRHSTVAQVIPHLSSGKEPKCQVSQVSAKVPQDSPRPFATVTHLGLPTGLPWLYGSFNFGLISQHPRQP